LRDPKGVLLAPEQRTQRAGQLVASALALALLDKGWQLETKPGLFYFHRDGEKTNIFATLSELLAGKVNRETWASTCAELGLTGSLLAPADTVSPAA
jgi:hypothetical protein